MNRIEPEQRSMPEINPEKVCFVVEKSRELESEDVDVPADASNPSDDGGHSVLTEAADAPLRSELTQYIDGLDVDEQNALVALAWIGRGDFEPNDWRAAVAQAADREEGKVSAYLIDIPMLSEYLEDALSEYGCSCADYEREA